MACRVAADSNMDPDSNSLLNSLQKEVAQILIQAAGKSL